MEEVRGSDGQRMQRGTEMREDESRESGGIYLVYVSFVQVVSSRGLSEPLALIALPLWINTLMGNLLVMP